MKNNRKRKENGFYLIGLSTVMVIVGIMPLLLSPIIKSFNDSEETIIYDTIEKSASYYIETNSNAMVWEEDSGDNDKTYSCVSVQTLLDTGYLKNSDLENYAGPEAVLVTRDSDNNILSREVDTEGVCSKNIKKIPIPTVESNCNDITYNGDLQQLTKINTVLFDKYSFSNNVYEDAGNYIVTASLNKEIIDQGYTWEDGSVSNKELTCQIKKAVPTVTIDPEGVEGKVNLKPIHVELLSNISGTISLRSSNPLYAIAMNDNRFVTANHKKYIVIKSLINRQHDTYITITFTPDIANARNYYSKSLIFRFGDVDIQTVAKPTAATYCNNDLVYNNSEQTLVKNAMTGFEFTNNKATNAGNYTVTANLRYGYVWDDGTTDAVNFTCSIKKATPRIILSDTGEKLYQTKNITTNIVSDVSGEISVSGGEEYITVKEITPSVLDANETGFITFYGNVASESQFPITITLNPKDQTNYYTSAVMYYLTVYSNVFNLSYNTNGGINCNPNSKEITLDKPYGDLCMPTKTNYVFKGWYTSLTDGELVTKDTIATVGDKKIYARWEGNKYKLSYDNNDGGGCDTKVITFNEPYGMLCIPIRAGYNFKGWYTAKSGGNQVTKDTIVTLGDKLLYAQWTPRTYKVYLDQQGATFKGTTDLSVVYDNEMPNVKIPEKKYTITYDYANGNSVTNQVLEYQFVGYYTEIDSGDQYYNQFGVGTKKWDKISGTVLYARWNPRTVKLPTPVRSGYSFVGWYDEKGKKVGEGGTVYTPKSNTRLTARWGGSNYTITFSQQDSTQQGTTSVVVNYGSKLPTIKIPSRAHTIIYNYGDGRSPTTTLVKYEFAGYYTSINGGKQYYDAKGNGINTWDRTSNTVLYPRWIAGSTTLLSPARTGYTFSGWYTESTGGKMVGGPGSRYIPQSNMILYARWLSNSYNITLDTQGAINGKIHVLPIYYGKILPNVAVPIKEYVLKYYYNNGNIQSASYKIRAKFDGYYTGINGTGEQYFSNYGKGLIIWNKTTNATVYAKWSPGTATLVTPTREGYKFKGWFTSQTGGAKVGEAGTKYLVRGDTNLYAQWEKIS